MPLRKGRTSLDGAIDGTKIPAGQRVVVSLFAADRDPRRWDDPNPFRIGHPRIREHSIREPTNLHVKLA